jgi:pimeloyl-ACP methyl ester carboxylesterase
MAMVKIRKLYFTIRNICISGLLVFIVLLPLIGFLFPNSNGTPSIDQTSQNNFSCLDQDPPTNNTLLLVHGYGINARVHFEDTYTDPAILAYYNSVVPIDYYGAVPSAPQTYSLGRSDFNYNTPIEDIAWELKEFILNPNNSALFTANIDIIGYSMGGLIVRYMISNYYDEIKAANFTIDEVVLIATPNHGIYHIQGFNNLFYILYASLSIMLLLVFLYSGDEKKKLRYILILICLIAVLFANILLKALIFTVQAGEVGVGSAFLKTLDTGDDTPYSVDDSPPYNDINWTTFRGDGSGGFFFERLLIFFSFVNEPNDGEVTVGSVPLGDGAINYGPYPRNHDEMVMFNTSIEEDRLYFSNIYYVLTGQTYPG